MKPIKVGICELGAVSGGTSDVLERDTEEITRRAGRGTEIAQIAVCRPNPKCDTDATPITADIFDVACNPEINMAVEPISGYTLVHELVLKTIENGKHVVTANKALTAVHGNEIFTKTRGKGVIATFEATVAGGILVIKAIHEGLSANHINWLARITNDTGNFILSKVREKGCTFLGMLAEAQALGYVEADPIFDVESIDAIHRLTILVSIAFSIPLQFDKAYIRGISELISAGVNYADALGYRTKHLGVARCTEGGFELRVHPILIPSGRLITNVNGVVNVVMINSSAVGSTLYYGAGVGVELTTSSVVTNLVGMVRTMTSDPRNRVPHLALQLDALSDYPILPIEACESAYYLRIQTKDHLGVLAQMATILSKCGISIELIMQKEVEEQDGLAPMILVTHRIIEQRISSVITALEALEGVSGPVVHVHVEQLN